MIYCEAGDKPTVKYQFSGQAEKTYKSEYSPIEVITKELPIEASDNYKNDGFELSWQQYSNSVLNKSMVRDYKIWTVPNSVTGKLITLLSCGQKWSNLARDINARPYSDGYGVVDFHPNGFAIDTSKKCPPPISNDERCSIQIIHNNLVIFQDQGNCPVNFDVSCSNCPGEQCESKTSIYPGYCCLNCASVANDIRSITNIIRGLNNGRLL